jgi:hypothetical protein
MRVEVVGDDGSDTDAPQAVQRRQPGAARALAGDHGQAAGSLASASWLRPAAVDRHTEEDI